ncbi:hypothetical protein [Benzoatithermus flavus]|uniref:Uncharacterized protein n=1 Tax=Benzoatithermus flavus TaxID=3108223 RepID=A0ABU8XTM1_9PROT
MSWIALRACASFYRAGLPAPDAFAGEVIAALARAGVFRLRACLVGTMA